MDLAVAVATAVTVGVGGADFAFIREDDQRGRLRGEVNRLVKEGAVRVGEAGGEDGMEGAVI